MAYSAPTDPASTATSSTTRPPAQTPSPARTTAGASPAAYRVARHAPPKRAVERSCIVCHRRKVRCDKTMPCANCVRSGVLCCYPSSKRTRQPKTTIADIASRLVQLERTIVAVAGGDGGGGDDSGGYESDTAPAPTQARVSSNGHRNGNTGNGSLGAAIERRAAGRSAPTSISTALAANHGNETRSSGTPTGGAGEDDTSPSRDGTQSENGAAAQEILLQNAYASRYINELLLSKILDEEEEFRSALASPKEAEAETDDSFDNDASETAAPAITLFGMIASSRHIPRSPSSSRNVNTALHPPRRQAMQLWHEYLHSIEPMNKVLHVPTAEVGVFTAIHSPEKTEPAFESLLFSIYYATVTAYQPEEYRAAFGEDKAVGLDRYRAGMERALVQARFLESPTLPTLQALTLFLRTSRAHSPGQSIWVLYGMVLRLAQSIGLHRDGANFNLSPFESEIRRRVWGHMIKQDDRAAEDHGIDIGLTDTGVDCQEALNLNDREIHPDMVALPVPQMRWTEMTIPVCLRRLGITMEYMTRLLAEMKATQHVGSMSASASSSARLSANLPLTEERRRAIMAERNAYVEDLLRQCNMIIPVQRATYKIVRLIQLKMDFVTRLQLAAILAAGMRAEGDRHRAIANEGHLMLACEIIELNVDIMDDELIQDYRWTAEIYPQYHTLLYVLWHLCVQPVPLSRVALRDRAWAVAEGMYVLEDARQRRQNMRGRNSKWAVLMALREKALRVRAAMDAVKGGSGGATVVTTEKGGGEQDVHMDDGASAKPSADVDVPTTNDGAAVACNAVLPTQPAVVAAVSVPASAASTTGFVSTDPGGSSSGFVQTEFADADMTEFLGDSALGLGMDMDWVRGFMDWNAVADDFRMRTYDAGT